MKSYVSTCRVLIDHGVTFGIRMVCCQRWHMSIYMSFQKGKFKDMHANGNHGRIEIETYWQTKRPNQIGSISWWLFIQHLGAVCWVAWLHDRFCLILLQSKERGLREWEVLHPRSKPHITIFVNLRLSLVSNLIYGPQQHGLMFGPSNLNHLDMSS